MATYLKWLSSVSIPELLPVPDAEDDGGDLAVMLTGGGARAAYQVGLLKGIAHHFPRLQFQIVTGVSAGAINATFLAAKQGLQYGVDPSTANRATIGGGVANNSCGAHSVIFGKTIDQVRSLDWQGRQLTPAGRAPTEVVEEVGAKLSTLLPFGDG